MVEQLVICDIARWIRQIDQQETVYKNAIHFLLK